MTPPDAAPTYHERQSLQQCLRHTLNNLLQRPALTSRHLDALADGLTPPAGPLGLLGSPHRTPLLGNYDVHVLEIALRELGKELSWVNMGASAPAVQQPAATRSHVPATDPGVVDTPVNGQNGATDPRVDDPRVKAVAEALSRPGLWAVILNVPAPPPANPVLWGLSSMAAAATGGQRRHWLGLKRFGDTWYNLDSMLPQPQLFASEAQLAAFVLQQHSAGAHVLLALDSCGS